MSEDKKLLDVLNYTYLGIITYPDNLSKYNVSSMILKHNIGPNNYPGVIVTKEPEITENKIKKEGTTDETFSNIIFFDYSDIENLKSIVKGLIIIDDAVDFYESMEGKDLKDLYRKINDNNTYLILLCDSKVEVEQLRKIVYNNEGKKIFESSPIFFSISDTGKKLKFPVINNNTFHPVVITDFQLKKINGMSISDRISRNDFLNIAYPYEIESYISEKTGAGEENNFDFFKEIIDIFGIDKFLKYCPKIKKIFEVVNANIDVENSPKHVIYVNTENGYFGMFLLYYLFIRKSYDGEKNQNNGIIPICIYKDDEDDVKIESLKTFNDQFYPPQEKGDRDDLKYNVLITNTELPELYKYEDEETRDKTIGIISAKNIDHYHILNLTDYSRQELIDLKPEQIGYLDINMKKDCINNIKKLFKDENYDDNNVKLNVHFYYNTARYSYEYDKLFGKDKNGVKILKEDLAFKEFYQELLDNYKFYNLRWQNGYKISESNPSEIIEDMNKDEK